MILRQNFGGGQVPTDRKTIIAIAQAVGADTNDNTDMSFLGIRIRLHNVSNGSLPPGSRIDASCSMMRSAGVNVC